MLLNKKTEKKIRYAVIGLGHIAQNAVLPAFRHADSNSVLSALVSSDRMKLNRLGERYGVEKQYHFSELEDCLRSGDIDAVYIATPNSCHRTIMETAAKYGVHVLCEKPMAVTVKDALSMITEAQRNNIFLMIAYRLRFEASHLRALKLAQSRHIGDLKIFNSVFTIQVKDPDNIRLDEADRGGGPLYDIGISCINAARGLFEEEPIEVFAIAESSKDHRFRKTDESISCLLKFPQGRLASFTVSFGAFSCADFDLIGTKGRIRLEKAYEYEKSMTLKIYEEKKIITRKYPRRNQFAQELLHFSDCILKDRRPGPSGEEGLLDLKIIEALLLSIDLRSPVQLEEISRRARPPVVVKPARPKLLGIFS